LVSILLYNRLKAPAAPARSLTRITFDEGLQSDPTWSPDGRYIAYTAVRDGLTNVWMQQMSVGDPIQITTGPGPNWQPDWSPDGKYIAYRSDAVPAGLYVIPALGGVGQQRRVASFGCNPRWSPNGSQILFQSGPSPWKGVDRFYAVGLDGGPPRQVLAEFFKQHASILPISAAWHPDGKRVTVWAENRSTAEPAPHFWTVPLDGGPAVASEIAPQIEQKFRELAVNSGDEWVVDTKFAWAPAANAIYLERTFRGARNLWRLHMDPKTLRATSVDQLTASGGLDTGPAISPDGKRLAFTAANGRVSVWLYPFDPARGKITGPGRAVTSPGLDAWLPNLTPDGDKLAFSGVRAGQSHLWVKSLPDGREIPLFVDRLYRGNPQWSPDGTHLAYYRGGDKPDQGQLMMWSAETRQEEPLTSPRSSEPHLAIELVYDWTPNGKSILATKVMFRETAHEIRYEPSDSFGEQSLWQIPVSSAPHAELQERKIIADPSYDLYQAHMSPNQRWIVFEALPTNAANGDPDRPSSLFVRRATGGPWLPLVDDQNPADKPRWSPDGRILYFLWGRGSFYNVWGLHFDPETGKPKGEPFRVTSFDSPALMVPGHMGTVEISVSRNNLALTLGQLSGGIWVLDNVDR
jgi:Tol biopolymer transport system component